jgi:hypothetical protein
MTDDLAARVEALERRASWLRRWVLVLSAALVSVAVAGASGPKELTLRKLTIEDDKGKPRIVAGIDAGDGLTFFDPDGKLRIVARTGGFARLWFLDRDGRERIVAEADWNGSASIAVNDRDGKVRIGTGTTPDGASSIDVYDSNGQETWSQQSK